MHIVVFTKCVLSNSCNLLYPSLCRFHFYIVPPVVAVVITNYTAFVGSSVALACQIIYEGYPRASFRWRRHGLYVSNDHIVTNDTHTMLLLTNLTEEDYGFYRCVADGVLTYDIHEVYLSLQGDCMHYLHSVSYVCKSKYLQEF